MWVFSIILAIFAALTQSTIAPSLSVYGGTIDIILVVLLVLLFYGHIRHTGIFLVVSAIILSIISGIQLIYLILPYFVLAAIYLFLSSRRIISRPSTIVSLTTFFIASVFANLVSILEIHNFSVSLISSVLSSAILNMLVGGTIYYFCNKVYYSLNPQISREKVKFLNL